MKQRGVCEPGPATGLANSTREVKGRSRAGRRLFVLDTNVLMHDPTAIFRFEEHDVYLPMVVLEELDAHKKGLSEASRNVRQVSRFLDDMMRDATKEQIDLGLELPSGYSGNHGKKPSSGRLYFQTRRLGGALPESLPGQGGDNTILAQTLALQNEHPDSRVILVSKDINLRIKAAVLGVHAEDYYSDKTLEDSDVLYTGLAALPGDFWERHGAGLRSWKDAERTFYEISGPAVRDWQPNQGVFEDAPEGIEGLVRKTSGDTATIELTRDYRNERHNVWGITARNREQNFALNLLMDPEVDFVTVLGPAGTGKTLLALAAGLTQTLETNRFAEIIMTRVTIPLGEDIGFLPGTEEEKMEPWMGALMDNLEVLTGSQEGGNWGRAATNDLLRNRIKGPLVPAMMVNMFVYHEGDKPFLAMVKEIRGKTATLQTLKDFSHHKNNVWGITARNREQNFALNLLMDPEIDFVTLLGQAGTGKTLLTLAAGLMQTLDYKVYSEIIMTRVTVPVGEDIGFLPGTEEEKMTPWMGALEDNLDVLMRTDDEAGDWGRAATADLIRNRIKVKSLNFMRGRTFINKYLIIDEAQNLTPKQMKTLITRAGPGTKVVCLGNIAQIDTPY
ncbi:MAG: PhoH family protein, partial [Acetobacteraceae bacterium]|nr:PhoH family protein [Acetobacteraceae bacterium]